MLSLIQDFLASREPLLTSPSSSGFPPSLGPVRVWLQPEPNGLEVVLVESSERPRVVSMRLAWKARNQGRANPVLVVACYPTDGGGTLLSSETKAAICGPLDPNPVVHLDLDPSQVERMAEVALDEPNQHAATRFLLSTLSGLDSPVPGLRNEGLLATHELHHGVDQLEKWPDALRRSTPLLRERGRHLVEKLGFTISQVGANTSMLAIQGADRAIAVFCQDKEPFDSASDRFDGASPVSRGLAMADQRNVDWLILTRASEIRLYAAKRDTGVGRKGRAETFVELNLALLSPDRAGYLHLLFSSEALADGGTLADILASSERYAVDLASRLRERVYYETVPYLARAISRQIGRSPDPRQLEEAYQQVMLILFRLLFVAYAEAKDLLPYSTNNHYQDASLTKLMIRLREDMEQEEVRYDPRGTQFWDRVNTLWNAVDQGNRGWGVPAYNGGLFSHDPEISPAGAALSDLSIPDAELVPVLNSLLLDETDEGYGPVDFRALSVREFGTIYEGLLESNLAVAPHDLAVKRVRNQDTYVPARPNDEVVIEAGEVYLHNRSGVRKATGSYFTKPFAVEHLLDTALEAALDHHIELLDRLLNADAQKLLEKAFFDFRCADIAMGSGHFLVAALDRIEARLSAWLALHPVPSVTNELNRLRETALESLGELGSPGEIETSSLIRRQVARHCVYGVDLNPMAVELARLAIWVHTFVPGLPLSFLDHNLVCGDSLTGVGTLDEVVAELDPNADPNRPSLWRGQIEELLERSKASLIRLARTSDATKREIDQAREAHLEATEAVAGAKAVFDLVSAYRAGVLESLPENFDECTFIRLSQVEEVVERIQNLNPVHFPAAFPEVFLKENPGFDCVIGNPPWEKVVVDREVWWGMYLPGVRALPVAERRAQIDDLEAARPDLAAMFNSEKERAEDLKLILRATFPKLGSGQTDLYKAFSWANLALCKDGGKIGIVLPRSAVSDAGMTNWRTEIVGSSVTETPRAQGGGQMSVATLINHKGWVFEGVHNSYTVALVGVTRSSRSSPASIPDSGPSMESTAGTRSRWSQSTRSTAEPTLGGGFEEIDEPHVAIYPGPANSLPHFREVVYGKPELIPVSEFSRWSSSAAFPQIPTRSAFRVWRKIKRQPRFDGTDQRERERERERFCGETGDSARFRGTSTRRSIDTGGTTTVGVPPGRRVPLHPRPRQLRERRWRFRPVREFDSNKDRSRFMNDDGAAINTPPNEGGEGVVWPVYKGISFNLWTPDTGIYYDSADSEEMVDFLQERRLSQSRTRSSAFYELDEEVINDPTTLPCLSTRIAFRDVTNPTNTRTIVAALVPGNRVIVNQAPYLLRTKGEATDEAFVLGVLCSMPCDWQARRTVELHMTFAQIGQFSIPDPGAGHPIRDRVVKIAGRLAAVDDRFTEWADEVGVPVGSANEEPTKSDLIHELDACVAHLYGLDESDLEVIYTTFSQTVDYSERHAAVLEHFRRWGEL